MKAILPRMPSTRLFPLLAFYGQPDFRVADFCRDVDAAPDQPPRRGERPPDTLGRLLRTIKARVVLAAAAPAELFRVADPGRRGFCRRERTAACLAAAGVDLGDDDLALLHASFEGDGGPERFDYRALCRALEGVPMDRTTAAREVVPGGE
jgi:hypothetical protein